MSVLVFEGGKKPTRPDHELATFWYLAGVAHGKDWKPKNFGFKIWDAAKRNPQAVWFAMLAVTFALAITIGH